MSLRTGRGKLHGQLSFIDLAGSEKGSDVAENEKKVQPLKNNKIYYIKNILYILYIIMSRAATSR